VKIKDILKLDLKDDIKNVIDLQDQTEIEIQHEIESYIVTNGIGEHLHSFIDKFTSNIKETGVWISGFYGSGKSYFGKMLGYLIANPSINGTKVRDRFIPRLRGVNNEDLIESSIRKLDSKNSRVIFLDIAKQNTDKGLSYTLFSNFLKNISFRDDVYGYIEFDLFIDGKYSELEKKCLQLFNKDWKEVKKSNREVAKALGRIHLEMDYSEEEYQRMLDTYSQNINNFSPDKLKEELTKYINKIKDETLVFIFDETSEAINQKKFKIDELQGISESLSSINQKVWTIAIAQEKLDDVINNANISKKDINKVTDRFKTAIHLESTEVDLIIRSRLLQKKEEINKSLIDFYNKNNGEISEVTNLNSSFTTKVDNSNDFATYYPFHKYQFKLLQNFLFASNALTANQIAARGMIITTFDVLRRHLKEEELYSFTTANELCMEGQTQPEASLINKYDNAKRIISDKNLGLIGDKLLRVINFLSKSEFINPTLENITKSYINNIKDYYEYKPRIQKALEFLVEGKILLLANNIYKITSDQESKLLDQMRNLPVELYSKKSELLNFLKKIDLFKNISSVSDDAIQYIFKVQTDSDEDIVLSKNENLKLKVYGLYSIDKDFEDFIQIKKIETQYIKDIITLVPNNNDFNKIDKLIEEIKRYKYIEGEYSSNSDTNIRQIIRSFASIREEKEKDLIIILSNSYANGSLVYMFDNKLLSKDTFKSVINEVQKKVIKNIYTKRLSKQMSDSSAMMFLTKKSNQELYNIVSGDDFKFFDENGNFIGEHLKVVDEISQKINQRYLSGKEIEEQFSSAPWGYSYGTIVTTLSVLFRAGRLTIKYNGQDDKFDFKDKEVQEVFRVGKLFQNSRFKVVNKTLSSMKKHQLVESLLDLDFEKHTGKKVDWNTTDFDLSNAIVTFTDNFISSINSLNSYTENFEKLFSSTIELKSFLSNFTSKVTESNYIEKIEDFLNSYDNYKKSIDSILKTEKFVKKNLDNLKKYKKFISDVKHQLDKASITDELINIKNEEFDSLYKSNLEANFSNLEAIAQVVKDKYFSLMKDISQEMSEKYKNIKLEVEKAKKELELNYPLDLNESSLEKLNNLIDFCNKRIINNVFIDFDSIECKNCQFSLSEISSFKDLANQKSNDLVLLKGNFVKDRVANYNLDNTSENIKEPKRVLLKIDRKIMTAKEYRDILTQQLQSISNMDNQDKIELIYG
jgi:hypothetical protein